jgi:hypothetical protein
MTEPAGDDPAPIMVKDLEWDGEFSEFWSKAEIQGLAIYRFREERHTPITNSPRALYSVHRGGSPVAWLRSDLELQCWLNHPPNLQR